MSDCVFCRIESGDEPAIIVRQWPDCFAIIPLNPVTPGHVLIIPREHVTDFADDPDTSAVAMYCATLLAQELDLADANIITSKGRAATQSVFHLHLHLVPRAENDGLALPWYSGRRKGGAA